MPDMLTGRCNCGAVSATFAARPVQTRQCWCRQCQKTAAGGPTHNAMFRTGDVALQGDLGQWCYTASSANVLTQTFCRACGTPVFAQSSARPQFMTFRIGFLEGDHDIAPEMAIWTAEKPVWAVLDPSLPAYPAQPPPPPEAPAS